MLGASALHRLSHPDGELATARAAAAAGSLMMVSTSTSTSLEAIAENVPDRWMQLYWMNDRAITRDIVARAEAAGFENVALTVDAPYMGWREDEAAHGRRDTGPVTQVVFPDRSGRRVSRSTARRPGRTSTGCAASRGCPSCSRA
ncbi:MAG: alpha-hydroxy-acid oxidizing protein [Chloroflexota bacterium]